MTERAPHEGGPDTDTRGGSSETSEADSTPAVGQEQPRREPYAMVPRSLILGRIIPEDEQGNDAMAVHLYCFLDWRQGVGDQPVRGYRHASKALGWDNHTVATYARLLARVGLIDLDEGNRRAAVMTVIHNGARRRLNPDCSLDAVEDPRHPPKAGTRASHARPSAYGEDPTGLSGYPDGGNPTGLSDYPATGLSDYPDEAPTGLSDNTRPRWALK